MEGATDLRELLGDGPVQNHPQGTTYAPMVTGGGDPFSAPQRALSTPSLPAANHSSFSYAKQAVKSAMLYFGFFLAAVLISLSTPRSLILQYIPNTYTAAGVPSYMGAAILAGVAVLVAYVFGMLGSSLI
jgi:hypothetical protein